MLVQASQGQSGSAHVVVLGNEKGGSGKSTTALHIAVALMKAGQRVATVDLDCRQQSFTRYIHNRSAWARRTGLDLDLVDRLDPALERWILASQFPDDPVNLQLTREALPILRRRPPRFAFEVAFCNLKFSLSFEVSWKIKSAGNRRRFRLTCWLSRFTGTP